MINEKKVHKKLYLCCDGKAIIIKDISFEDSCSIYDAIRGEDLEE